MHNIIYECEKVVSESQDRILCLGLKGSPSNGLDATMLQWRWWRLARFQQGYSRQRTALSMLALVLKEVPYIDKVLSDADFAKSDNLL